MKFLATFVFVTSSIALMSGCAKPSYVVTRSHDEFVRKKLDAEWFTRDIYDGTGLAAVELTYCPIQPNTQMVCRTGVVWVRDTSALIDEEPSTIGAVPAVAPSVAQ